MICPSAAAEKSSMSSCIISVAPERRRRWVGIPWEGAPRDPMRGEPSEREHLGSPRDLMGGDPDPQGRGTLGRPRDPMGGGPWGPIASPFKRIL